MGQPDTERDALYFPRHHLVPMGAALLCFVAGIGAGFLLPDFQLMVYHVTMVFSGLCIGALTWRGTEIDHRGTNGMFLLLLAWAGMVACSRMIFPELMTISDWFWLVMCQNLINAACLLGGIFTGSPLHRMLPFWSDGDEADYAAPVQKMILAAKASGQTPVSNATVAPARPVMPSFQAQRFNQKPGSSK